MERIFEQRREKDAKSGLSEMRFIFEGIGVGGWVLSCVCGLIFVCVWV
jgi:hypothetical protein